nr:hypothetical protein [Tolivirales sp.]
MAGKKVKKSIKVREAVRVKRAPRRRGASVMSSALENHLRMVVDPCNAPLTETAYPNASGVIRDRRKQVLSTSHTPTSTAGTYCRVIAWHPILGGLELAIGTTDWPSSTEAGCNFRPLTSLSRYSDTNALYSGRGVGGCLTMSWAGKELDRRGMIYSGVVSGGLIWTHLSQGNGGAGATVSPNTLAAALTTTCRTPNDKCEVTWVPTEYDSAFTDLVPYGTTSSTTLQEQFSKLNFVLMIGIFPQAVNDTAALSVTALSIAEVNPALTIAGNSNIGLVQDAAHVNTSGVPGAVTRIVKILQSQDTAWYINTFKKLGKFGMKVAGAYARGGALGLVAEVAGMSMSARKNVNA